MEGVRKSKITYCISAPKSVTFDADGETHFSLLQSIQTGSLGPTRSHN